MEIATLDLLDKKIIEELDKNCRQSNTQLAKRVKRSREVVAYRIQKLQEQGIITGFITSINPNAFGYLMHKVYIKLENIPKEKNQFFKELKTNKDIYWMGISDGAFDCVIAILSKSVTQYYETINNFLSKWKHLIIHKTLGTMVDTKQFTKQFLTNKTSQDRSFVTFGSDTKNYQLDKLEAKILEILANDARMSIVNLAKQTKSTIEIIRHRMKKLEKQQIILQYRVALDFTKLGIEFFKAIIYFKSLSKQDEASLKEWMRAHPKSLYYIRSLAPWEAELEFATNSYNEFNQIMKDLTSQFHHVIRNHEHLIMNYESWMPGYHKLLLAK